MAPSTVAKVILLICASVISCSDAVCYFPQEQQGLYKTQTVLDGGSVQQYLSLTILPDTIPEWGSCSTRLGSNVILSEPMGRDTFCMRCYHFTQRSPHVLEVHTESLDKCYTTEQAAIETCPTRELIRSRRTLEIMLYKSSALTSDAPLPAVYCPINGRFGYTYDLNDGSERVSECPSPNSRVSNCPKGNMLTLEFKKCSFEDFVKTFECLGDWQGADGRRYLALGDPTAQNHTGRPRYRCAMYSIEQPSGKVYLSLSSDSTCFNNLTSPRDGYETLVMTPIAPPPPPITVSSELCQFPSFAQGQWEQVRVEGNTLSYTDLESFKTYKVYCLDGAQESQETGLMPVFAQSQCGEEVFTCLAVHERSTNVMEFQMGTAGVTQYRPGLCSNSEPQQWGKWLTQGRVDRFRQSACPVAGEYRGYLPDAPSLCAKLYSDCNNPEIMFFTVYSCLNRSEVFEEREYRCLGQWAEASTTYTYTERRDVPSYECFAGVVVNDGEIYIMEAGTNCNRGLDVTNFGMKLLKQAACITHPRWVPPPPRRLPPPPPPPHRTPPTIFSSASTVTPSTLQAVTILSILLWSLRWIQ